MKRYYKRYVPLDIPQSVEEVHDSQGLLDAVKAEFFPDEAGPWYTIQLYGASDSVSHRKLNLSDDSCTAFASLAGIFAQTPR